MCKIKGLPNYYWFYLDGGMNITPNVMAIHQTVVTTKNASNIGFILWGP